MYYILYNPKHPDFAGYLTDDHDWLVIREGREMNPYKPPKTDPRPEWDRGIKYTKPMVDWADFFFVTVVMLIACFSPPLVHWLTGVFKDIFNG